MSASLPSISLMTEAATISPLALFMQADIVVKVVMLGLLLASIWTWAIILSFALKLSRTKKAADKFEQDFWKSRSEEHTSELQSLMRISYAVFCLKKKNKYQ